MVKSKYSATYSLRIYTPTLSMKWSSMPMDESEVDGLIEAAIEEGAIVYEPRRNEEQLQRDFFAHAALYRDGWRFTVLTEIQGQSNIDLLLVNGEYWEVKSPTSSGNAKNRLGFVDSNLRTAHNQFRGHGVANEQDAKVVFNNHYTDVDDAEVINEIKKRMPKRNIAEVVFIKKDGTIKRIKKPQVRQ